ncbi:hypothetical protein [Sphingomonas sp. PB1R3]|uniref:hypothetical protein n=1 Tax=Sphingomonas flavida TaxID=3096154 RepID=UPI002FC72926
MSDEGEGTASAGRPRRPRGPAWDVEVKVDVGTPTYIILAEQMYGWDAKDWWEDLGDLLGGRPGWHCDFTGEALLWSFGPFGSSLFNVSPPDDAGDYGVGAYELFDYEADETHRFATTAALLSWLEANEHRHADHVRKLKEYASAFEWRVLKDIGVELRVTHDGSVFIGTFPDIAFESAFAADVPTLLAQAREAVARAHDAPPGIAPEIDLIVRLDPKASAALT